MDGFLAKFSFGNFCLWKDFSGGSLIIDVLFPVSHVVGPFDKKLCQWAGVRVGQPVGFSMPSAKPHLVDWPSILQD